MAKLEARLRKKREWEESQREMEEFQSGAKELGDNCNICFEPLILGFNGPPKRVTPLSGCGCCFHRDCWNKLTDSLKKQCQACFKPNPTGQVIDLEDYQSAEQALKRRKLPIGG